MRTILFSLILLITATTSALAERRVALIIGNERYAHLRPLENPLNDAFAVEETLLELGFEVWIETNRSLKRMRRALEDFQEDAAGADVALFFFAGHGMEVDGHNHLMPVDAGGETLQQLSTSSLPLNEVAAVLNKVSRHSIMIIDACRSDAFGDGAGRAGIPLKARQSLRAGMGRMGQAQGMIYAFASAPGAAALDGTGDNSPFTTALLRHIGTAGIELRSAFTLVQQEVYDRTRGQQLPYVESGLPALIFASGNARLPEREQLLLAMARLSAEDRTAVERTAAQNDMPLAPLFGALISHGTANLSQAERDALLTRAAERYAGLQNQIRQLSAADPKVIALRKEALQLLDQGSFKTAQARLSKAIELDETAIEEQVVRMIFRLTSQAESRLMLAYMLGTQDDIPGARTEILAALDLYDRTMAMHQGLMPDEAHDVALRMLYDANVMLEDHDAALQAIKRRLKLIRIWYDSAPEYRPWLAKLSETFQLESGTYFQLGDIEKAIESKRAELATLAYVADLDNASPEQWWPLVEQLEALAKDAKDRGFPQQAKPALLSGLNILENLVEIGHDTQRTQFGMAVYHQHLGDLAVAQDTPEDATEAERHFASFARIAQAQLDRPDPEFPWVSAFLFSKTRQAQLALTRDAPDEATAHLQEALRLTAKKRAPIPSQASAAYDAVFVHLMLADIHSQNPQHLAAAQEIATALRQQRLLDPDQNAKLEQSGLPSR